MTPLLALFHLLLLLGAAQATYVIPAGNGSGDWKDSYKRAKALVAKMSKAEKLSLTQQVDGTARVGAVDRLGYGGLFYADGSEGIRGAPYASAFNQASNSASSFDRDLMRRRAVAIGAEARAKGINTQFGPGVNLLRIPEGGRGFEYFGADPYLAGAAAAEHVKGVQSQRVQAMMRHYIGNEQEDGRTWINVNLDDRTAHELYLWPFQDAVHAGVVSTMCAYNGVNGAYACAGPESLGKWLHEELAFQGFVLSDFGAIFKGIEVDAANAGCDTVIGFQQGAYGASTTDYSLPWGVNSSLSAAIDKGAVSEDRLTDMATRIVAAWYQVGQDKDFPALNTKANVLSQNTNALIRELGAKSAVLLKNSGILPFNNVSDVYVFGSAATVNMEGFPLPVDISFAMDDDMGAFAGGQGSSYANLPYLITPFEALQTRARQDGSQVFGYFNNYNHSVQATHAAAADALGAPCLVDVRQQCSEGYDRPNLTASWEGDATILAVAGQCKNTVVVYSSCGPFNATSWADHANVTAIINTGGMGQEGGNALVDVLYGDVNPSARLPYTIGRLRSDYPVAMDPATLVPGNTSFVNVTYSEGLFIDYRWFDKQDITPLYEFGFGLSYTTFEYSKLRIQTKVNSLEASAGTSDPSLYDTVVEVQITVKNTGSRDGTEIPQLYLGSPAEGAPVKILRGFEAVPLKRGQQKSVTFALTRRDFSYWDSDASNWALPKGKFNISVGASSRDIRATGNVELTIV